MHLVRYVRENVCFIHEQWYRKHAAWLTWIVKEY